MKWHIASVSWGKDSLAMLLTLIAKGYPLNEVVFAELKPRRKVNLPDFPAIVRAAMADGVDICVYCQSFDCNECIVNEWKSERSNEE